MTTFRKISSVALLLAALSGGQVSAGEIDSGYVARGGDCSPAKLNEGGEPESGKRKYLTDLSTQCVYADKENDLQGALAKLRAALPNSSGCVTTVSQLYRNNHDVVVNQDGDKKKTLVQHCRLSGITAQQAHDAFTLGGW